MAPFYSQCHVALAAQAMAPFDSQSHVALTHVDPHAGPVDSTWKSVRASDVLVVKSRSSGGAAREGRRNDKRCLVSRPTQGASSLELRARNTGSATATTHNSSSPRLHSSPANAVVAPPVQIQMPNEYGFPPESDMPA
jgi:hypothetical protein